MKSKERTQQKYKKVSCSKCSSDNVKKDGKRKTQYRGRYKGISVGNVILGL